LLKNKDSNALKSRPPMDGFFYLDKKWLLTSFILGPVYYL
jgi:hypothetical protein